MKKLRRAATTVGVVSVDKMRFDERGFILPVKITKDGVPADPISGKP